ncbi:hypothetical protein TNCV_601311 [Trichonephila clavipes]|nr:hypothetical protein TNCV_601311 [Trichonephila clavipes]
MNRLYPNSRRESIKENKYLNTLPAGEDGGRSGSNENETEVRYEGRNGRAQGRRGRPQNAFEEHQKRSRNGECCGFFFLFRIPASEKELDKIVLRVKNRVSDPPAEKNEEEKKPAAVPPPPPHPVQRVERRNEASMLTASLPQATC